MRQITRCSLRTPRERGVKSEFFVVAQRLGEVRLRQCLNTATLEGVVRDKPGRRDEKGLSRVLAPY